MCKQAQAFHQQQFSEKENIFASFRRLSTWTENGMNRGDIEGCSSTKISSQSLKGRIWNNFDEYYGIYSTCILNLICQFWLEIFNMDVKVCSTMKNFLNHFSKFRTIIYNSIRTLLLISSKYLFPEKCLPQSSPLGASPAVAGDGSFGRGCWLNILHTVFTRVHVSVYIYTYTFHITGTCFIVR